MTTQEAFILALDCGAVSFKELLDYEKSPAFIRARVVLGTIKEKVWSKGSQLTARTMIAHEHAYCIVYGDREHAVPAERQLQTFHVLDRYRQQWHQFGAQFVQFDQIAQDYFIRMREHGLSGKDTGTYTLSADEGILHETHEPRAEYLDHAEPPVPYIPPFESIPLHLEPTEKKPPSLASVGNLKRPLLERHLTYRRLVSEQTMNSLAKQYGKYSADMEVASAVEQSVIQAVWDAKKYEMANSGMALIASLLSDTGGTAIKRLPEMPLFMKFASPIDLGVYQPVWGLFFAQPQECYARYAEKHPGTLWLDRVDPVVSTFMQNWTLNLIDTHGETVLNLMYDSRRQAWKLPEFHHCQNEACVQLMMADEALRQSEVFTNWLPCPDCTRVMDYFARWFPVALLAIAGEFADYREEGKDALLRETEEEIITKEQRPGSGKYDEKRTRVRWRTITFDASVIKKKAAKAGESSSGERSSWYDLAVAQGTLFSVKRGFGKSSRHLNPARNPRWKSERDIPVRGYEKRIPMSLTRLRNTVTKVVSCKYEEK